MVIYPVSHYSHFLPTRVFLPIVPLTLPSRIVAISSGAQTATDFVDPVPEAGHSGSRAYLRSKLAWILVTFDQAAELANTGIQRHSFGVVGARVLRDGTGPPEMSGLRR
ncbi:MAG: hypothetical protein OXT72_11945 [Gammaproteobacteria bacterium]|nr:hypothetical protein [Gammaproteobacteria bacterium]MDE0246981.1 hypothetical protein [Gammaproteobacteria bacterium]